MLPVALRTFVQESVTAPSLLLILLILGVNRVPSALKILGVSLMLSLILHEAFLPIADIVTDPVFLAVNRPLLDMVAILGLLDFHFIFPSRP